jgi:dCTP deaminase
VSVVPNEGEAGPEIMRAKQMGVKPDHWIVRMARERQMIDPFAESQVSKGCISYGVSSYGYDFRIDRHYKRFRTETGQTVDPKEIKAELFEDYEGDFCVIPPSSFVIGRSVEYFRIPREVLTICMGKSTYARCGVLVNVTPFEPEWEGYVTMAVCNTSSLPVRIYSGEGIAQVVFLTGDEVCSQSYGDRKGKYQAQKDIVLSRVEQK